MRKAIHETGPYGIGMMVRLAHIAGSIDDMVPWYQSVFGAVPSMGFPEADYLESEDRYMTLVMIGDLCIEVMAPAEPVNDQLPVGKFYSKHGSRLHSIGSQVRDPIGLVRHLAYQGVHIAMPGGASVDEMTEEVLYCFPRPKDVAGLAVELGDFSMVEGEDPRTLENWPAYAQQWDQHPSTIQGLGHVTFGVRDLDHALKTYRAMWEVDPLEQGEQDELGYRYFTVQFGDCVLEVAEPTRSGTHFAETVERDGDMVYGVTLRVRDLDALISHLSSHDIATTRHSENLATADPSDTHQIPFAFSTETSEPSSNNSQR